jgi:small subunit ribosomal protein S20
MAITANAKKAHRASLKKHVFNVRRKRVVTSTVKEVKKLVVAGSKKEADASLAAAFKALDKAAKTGVIKKNTASRRKSRLAKAVAKVGAKA